MAARRRHPRRRSVDLGRRQRGSLVQLGVAILLLVMLIIFSQKLADGAAGCYFHITEAPDGYAADAGAARDAVTPAAEEGPGVRLKFVDAAP